MSRVMATLVGILTGIGEFAYSLLWGRRQARFIQNLLVDTDHLPNRRVIVSLSTLPERISNLEPTLRCLLEQTRPPDEIVLAVPEFSIRQQKKYIVPGYLEKIPRLRILRCKTDWGPATKFIPIIQEELAAGRGDTLDGWLHEQFGKTDEISASLHPKTSAAARHFLRDSAETFRRASRG